MAIRGLPLSFRGQLRSKITDQWRGTWICRSCALKSPARASFSSSQRVLEKPYYVTTPIFYVNGEPHVGHLYSLVLTDILKRWQVLRGRKTILCTGTDEHGMKIQQAAARNHLAPKEFCDQTSPKFAELAKEAGVSYDHFVRTTDEDHKEAVQYFWHMLKTRGYIYESKHEGWYCVSDETFYPESGLEKRLDPFTGKAFMASQETGKEVEWTSETNYHFRLSALQDRLLEFYKANPEFVVPATRMKDVVTWVEAGLEDLSISRPVERLSWGIPVPDDPSQTIYVWLDALVNYITKAGYPWQPGKQSDGGWPADVHVIGKDIVRFHCIYWPAFLLALDIPPPKQVFAHAHWTMEGQKMAKSTGNMVSPFLAIDRFGRDAMRFYLTHEGGIKDDSDYGNHLISQRYRKVLQGGLGNLVSRITRPKTWNVRDVVKSAQHESFQSGNRNTELGTLLEVLGERVDKLMGDLDPRAAVQLIMNAVALTNQYLQEQAPWALVAKQKDLAKCLNIELTVADDDDHADRGDLETWKSNQLEIAKTVFLCAESCRIVGILLQPFMPTKADQILNLFGVAESRRTFDDARLNADHTYGAPLAEKLPQTSGRFDQIFPAISDD